MANDSPTTKPKQTTSSAYALYKTGSLQDAALKMTGGDMSKKEKEKATTHFCKTQCPIVCPSPFQLDEKKKACVLNCKKGELYDPANNKCVEPASLCGKGTAFSKSSCIPEKRTESGGKTS